MPELPEVETVVRGLKPHLEGQMISRVETRREGLRFPFPGDFKKRLEGRRIARLSRRAKYIIAEIEGGGHLLIHLGMTGRFTVIPPTAGSAANLGRFYFETGGDGGGPHDHVVLTLAGGARVVYTDPRRFGLMDLFDETHKLLDGLGIEPLGNDLNAAYLAGKFKGKAAPLKAALLDQHVVAGLGNIYACEALFRSGLSPARKARTLKDGDPRLETLVRNIRAVLTEAIEAGGSTLQDFAHTDGERGGFQQRFAVYDREGELCVNCGAPIKRKVQSGRSTFYCRVCQK